MRILKTTQTYLPYLENGGPPVKVSGLARALAQRGHQVTVLTADLGETNGHGPCANWSRKLGKWGWESTHDGVAVNYLPTLTNYRATTFNPRVLSFCSDRLADYELVHIYGLYDLIGPAVAWSSRRHGLPYVLEPLGMFGPKIRSQRKKRVYGRLVADGLFAGAAMVIATSEKERQELIDGGISEEKILLRRNGLDLEEFRNLPQRGAFRSKIGLEDDRKLLLFIGRISFIKGLDLLLQAFAGLDSDVTLVLAGPDDEDGCLKRLYGLVEELKLRSRVVLLPPLFSTDKLEALVDADLFVLPSRYESFGNAAAEAIACGTPVLVTSDCGIAPLIANRAGLVVPCQVEGMRNGLVQLVSDERLLAQLRAGTASVRGNLSWEEPVKEMEQAYRDIVDCRLSIADS